MSKVIIINDNSWFGGAQITNDSILAEGLNRNHDVEVYVYGKREREGERKFNPPDADLYILANYGYIPHEDLLKFISNNKFVRFFHDIPGFIAQIPSSFHVAAEGVLSQIINKAKYIFMISPMQYTVVDNRIPLPEEKVKIIPPFIQIDKFFDKKEDRLKDSWLYLGDVSPARGIQKSIEIAIQKGGKEFIIAGPQTTPGYFSQLHNTYSKYINITYIGQIEYEKVNNIMNLYENFIYTPEIYDSFCRKIIEAQAAGMNVFVDNRRIGAYSFPEDYDMKNGLLSANIILWDIIDNILKNGSYKNTVKEDTVNNKDS